MCGMFLSSLKKKKVKLSVRSATLQESLFKFINLSIKKNIIVMLAYEKRNKMRVGVERKKRGAGSMTDSFAICSLL